MKTEGSVPPTVIEPSVEGELGEALASLVMQGLRDRGRLVIRLQGDSMWPTIPAGTSVEVERVLPGEIAVGDVVVWQRMHLLIAHRVVQRQRVGSAVSLVTKGDNCSAADQCISADDVLGRLAGVRSAKGAIRSLGGWQGRLEAMPWVARWHVRSLLGRLARRLPWKIRHQLVRARDSIGYYISKGYQVLVLRRMEG